MSVERNKAVVLGFLDALAHGNREAAREAFAEDATWSYPPSLGGPGIHRGRDAIFDVYFAVDERLYETGTRRYDLRVRNTIAEGDSVAVEMRHCGRTWDGRAYETDYHVLYLLEAGHIRHVREYFDSLMPAELRAENTVTRNLRFLLLEILDHFLLVSIQPTGQKNKSELQLQRCHRITLARPGRAKID